MLRMKVTCPRRQVGGDAMLVVLMLFCAVGSVFLIGLSVYAEVRDLRHKSTRDHIDRESGLRTHHR
jgi:hypothetical protein